MSTQDKVATKEMGFILSVDDRAMIRRVEIPERDYAIYLTI